MILYDIYIYIYIYIYLYLSLSLSLSIYIYIYVTAVHKNNRNKKNRKCYADIVKEIISEEKKIDKKPVAIDYKKNNEVVVTGHESMLL